MSQAQLLSLETPQSELSSNDPYRVLARKTRPMSFKDVIGQNTLVQIITNGLRTGRLPHAFIFTGIRGTGKTTTARILAKALNCCGRDLNDSVEPCGRCEHCVAIAEDRHIDVIEMDAASRTGVDDIRDVIEAAKYKAVSAEYKVYIIDEVHMLSKSAFNALLKTLEEPPAHVKFIFATTEIRKVPKTVLSRCMRFDLRRVDVSTLCNHFTKLVHDEQREIEEFAVQLIARAADGSVRDGISLLDQALTMTSGLITVDLVSDMLGLADPAKTMQLLTLTIRGRGAEVLATVKEMYCQGVDPSMLVEDLLQLVHTLTSVKISPDFIDELGLSEKSSAEYSRLAQELTIPTLTRIWQILIKGRSELQMAPLPAEACEMLLLRIVYASALPTPQEVIKTATNGGITIKKGNVVSASSEHSEVQNTAITSATVSKFRDVVELVANRREPLMYAYLKSDVHLVNFEQGKIELRLGERAPENLPQRLGKLLREWTGQGWQIITSEAQGLPTLMEQDNIKEQQLIDDAKKNSLVENTLNAFAGAKIISVESNIKESKS